MPHPRGLPAVRHLASFQEASMEKDTLTFAVLLSLIDFLLSMVMITGIGLILYLLPNLNRLGKLDDESMRRGH
jgi:hypothetical protein